MATPEPKPQELQAVVADLHCQGCLNTWQPLQQTTDNIESLQEGKPFENTASQNLKYLEQYGAVETDLRGKVAAVRINSSAARFIRPGILEKMRYEIENGITR